MDIDNKFSRVDGLKLSAVLILSVLVIYSAFTPTFQSLNTLWTQNNHTYSHGYVLVLFIIYALYVQRSWFNLSPSFLAVPLGLCAGILWVLANAVQVLLIQQMLVPVMIALLFISVVGFQNAIKVWIPVGALFLAIPVMDFLLNPLQDLTTWAVSIGIRWAGITAFIDQYDIQIPYGTMRIADGCAGLNYFLAGITIGLFYSYLNLPRLRDRIVAISLILFLSIVGNWIRVFALVMIGYESKMQSELVEDHGFFGWVIFAVLMVSYFVIAERLFKVNEQSSLAQNETVPRHGSVNKSVVSLVLLCISLVSAPFAYQAVNSEYLAAEASPGVMDKSRSFNGYVESSDVSLSAIGARFEGHDEVSLFKSVEPLPNGSVIAVVTYRSQAQGKELIYYANRPASDLSMTTTVEIGSVRINTALAENGTKRVFWYYQVGEQMVSSGLEVKFLQLRYAFSPKQARAFILQVQCAPNCPADALESLANSEQLAQFVRLSK